MPDFAFTATINGRKVRRTAQPHQGSWWPMYAEWLSARSGGMRPAPTELGSPQHPALEAAPGRYVLDR